jgi:hypothetical protein
MTTEKTKPSDELLIARFHLLMAVGDDRSLERTFFRKKDGSAVTFEDVHFWLSEAKEHCEKKETASTN